MNSHFTVAYVPCPPERYEDWARAMELLTEIIIEAVEKEKHKTSAGLVWRTKTMAKLTKIQLEELVKALAWNDGFGCWTRPGFEKYIWPEIADKAEWIIYLDIDNMNALNSEHGKPAVNAMIKKSLEMRATDFVAGQWQSGDEFIICITKHHNRGYSDPSGLCERLSEVFRANGVPATFAIVAVISKDLIKSVEPADELVRVSKNANRRGTINTVEGDQR